MITIVLVSAHTFLLGMLLGMWLERRKFRILRSFLGYSLRSQRLNRTRPTWSAKTNAHLGD